jgi:hypothetical protein
MPEELSILAGLQKIKDGLLDPKAISKEDRQSYVEVLLGEEYTEVQIAEILKVSDKTIQRDIKDIREKNSLSPGVTQAKQIIGDFFKKAMLHHGRLVRLSREKGTSDENKIRAEFLSWTILKEMIAAMQSLGYLPLKPQEVVNDIYHHNEGGDSRTYEQLKQDLKDIERIARETGTLDPKAEEGIKLLQQRIEKAEIVEEIVDLNKSKEGNQNNKEDNHE